MNKQLTVVAALDDIDLRTVVAQSAYLRRVARKWSLAPYECVCFTNKARTRFRLVFRINGSSDAVFLCIPEIDQKSKYSVYLKVSEALANLTGIAECQTMFENLAGYTKERIQRSRGRRASLRRKSK